MALDDFRSSAQLTAALLFLPRESRRPDRCRQLPLVQIAAPRLRALGIESPAQTVDHGESPEHWLYTLLSSRPGGGVHSRYKALLARAASFERAGLSGQNSCIAVK